MFSLSQKGWVEGDTMRRPIRNRTAATSLAIGFCFVVALPLKLPAQFEVGRKTGMFHGTK